MIDFIEAVSIVSVELGMSAYAVGGFVRELFLGRENEDLDIAVEGDAILFAERMARLLNISDLRTHAEFQTALITAPSGHWIDIVTTRSEVYLQPGALPEITPSDLYDDLRRRDFTFNAMAILIQERKLSQLIDPFDGLTDLKNGCIRVFHERSFWDDPTRIFRALRYQNRFDFELDPQTKEWMEDALKNDVLETISNDRIRDELVAILKEQNPNNAFCLLEEWRIPKYIHPALSAAHICDGLIDQIQNSLTHFALLIPDHHIESWEVYLLGLISILNPKDAASFLDRYRFCRQTQKKIAELETIENENIESRLLKLDDPKPSQIDEILSGLSEEALLWLVAKQPLVRTYISRYLRLYRQVKPSLNGRDLIKLGIRPGKVMGDILSDIRRRKLDGELTTRDQEEQFVRHWHENKENSKKPLN